jgi:outer membrane protein, multidrug efflux system
VIARGMVLVLPSCGIPNLRQAEPGPGLPAVFPVGLNGATGSENSPQVGTAEFFNDPTLTRLIDQALVGNRELKLGSGPQGRGE